jgi:hypothetical protein
VCRDYFDEFVSRTLLPAINENSGKNKSWGVVLATSKIGIDEYDKVQTTCDRVFGFILFELFSIDVETYGAHIHLVCHECCTDLGLTSQTKQMFDKVQQHVLAVAKLSQKQYVQISLDSLNKEYLIYTLYESWGFLPVKTDPAQTNAGCGKKGKHSFKLHHNKLRWKNIPVLQNCKSGNPAVIADRVLVMIKSFAVDAEESVVLSPHRL